MWFTTAILTVGLVLAPTATAGSPVLTELDRVQVMEPEQAVEFAIATVTTDKNEAQCAKKIAYKESRYRIDALNKSSGARGVWQLMWGKPQWDILRQAQEAHAYVLHRYDSWCGAYKFHQERNWY
jgi:hypothetical protein